MQPPLRGWARRRAARQSGAEARSMPRLLLQLRRRRHVFVVWSGTRRRPTSHFSALSQVAVVSLERCHNDGAGMIALHQPIAAVARPHPLPPSRQASPSAAAAGAAARSRCGPRGCRPAIRANSSSAQQMPSADAGADAPAAAGAAADPADSAAPCFAPSCPPEVVTSDGWVAVLGMAWQIADIARLCLSSF